jgi:hypothetical protein
MRPLSRRSLVSGERIPSSGLYAVEHDEHLLPAQATLLRDQTFPACAACSAPVHFRQVRRMDYLDKLEGNIVIYVLPVLPQDKAA